MVEIFAEIILTEVGYAGPPNYSNIIIKNLEYAGTSLEL